jgi:hypothetical protein
LAEGVLRSFLWRLCDSGGVIGGGGGGFGSLGVWCLSEVLVFSGGSVGFLELRSSFSFSRTEFRRGGGVRNWLVRNRWRAMDPQSSAVRFNSP